MKISPKLLAIFASVAITAYADMESSTSPSIDRSSDHSSMSSGARVKSPHIDSNITRRIRQELAKDDFVSDQSKKIKVSTKDGDVFLRGNVKSEAERTRIVSIAKKCAGTGNVENFLQIQN